MSKHELVRAVVDVAAALQASGGSEGSGNWTGELVGRRVGGFMSWPAVLGHPRCEAARSGDRRRVAPCGICFLKMDSHCSVDSVTLRRLTEKFHRVEMAKSLLKSEICQDESCSPYSHLQFLFKYQGLILNRYIVKSRQN